MEPCILIYGRARGFPNTAKYIFKQLIGPHKISHVYISLTTTNTNSALVRETITNLMKGLSVRGTLELITVSDDEYHSSDPLVKKRSLISSIARVNRLAPKSPTFYYILTRIDLIIINVPKLVVPIEDGNIYVPFISNRTYFLSDGLTYSLDDKFTIYNTSIRNLLSNYEQVLQNSDLQYHEFVFGAYLVINGIKFIPLHNHHIAINRKFVSSNDEITYVNIYDGDGLHLIEEMCYMYGKLIHDPIGKTSFPFFRHLIKIDESGKTFNIQLQYLVNVIPGCGFY